jgi:hypothetical protein
VNATALALVDRAFRTSRANDSNADAVLEVGSGLI